MVDFAFFVAYFLLPLAAWVLPFWIGRVGRPYILSLKIWAKTGSSSSKIGVGMGIAFYLMSYLACVVVFSRFLELPWRFMKFGDLSLDLGRDAAAWFVLCATVVIAMQVALARRTSADSKAAKSYAAGVVMLIAAMVVYLLLGLTPLVFWRA